MTRHDDPIDRTLEELRRERLDDATVATITDRVWQRLAGAAAPLRGCDDVQAAIPDLVAGTLPAARARLVEDHTRGCVPCRRVLLEARGVVRPGSADEHDVRTARRLPSWLRVAAILLVTIGAAVLAVRTVGDMTAEHGLRAAVVATDGGLQRIDADGVVPLRPGAELRAGMPVRTSKDGGAVLRLADGSQVELAPRSELELHAGRRGTTIRLNRGNIIVEAAKQHGGRLYVATDDCRVAVKGTVFAVDHGLKGSRVSVVEGEVEVSSPAVHALLLPGEQVTTSGRLAPTTVADQIAWSRDADAHLALLAQLTRLGRDMQTALESAIPERHSSRLLDLVPEDTAVYLSIPNLTEGLLAASELLDQRLAADPTLRQWWHDTVEPAGVDREIEALLERLEPLGRTIGDEVVVAVPRSAFSGGGQPVVLAELVDEEGFRSQLEAELAALSDGDRPPLAVVDTLDDIPTGGDSPVMWLGDGLLVFGPSAEAVRAAARRALGDAPDQFVTTRLHDRLAEAYGRGVAWLVGLDLGSVLADAGDGGDASLLDRLGLLDARTLVVENRRVDDTSTTEAALLFDGPRHGMAGWLAAPAPMGGLRMVSSQASFAAAVVTRDAVDMLDELLAAVGPEAADTLGEIRRETGIDLRRDLAAALGGEAVVALDGPLLPTPAWKLVLEVYDPATLEHTIATAVARANHELTARGESPITLETVAGGGDGIRVLRHPKVPTAVAWTVSEGYAVFAPSPALVERALALPGSGASLADGGALRDLLPANDQTDCSLLVYSNLGPLTDALPDAAIAQLPAGALELLRQGAAPTVVCAYGLADRILLAAAGHNPLGFEPLAALLPVLSEAGPSTTSGAERLSSRS